ncbi:MAG: molybdopterin molybdotransferase MoeA [Planctomycetota bacterium]
MRATVLAGSAESPPVGPGEAVEVMTGGTVPSGADAVVPVEHTRIRGEGAKRILELETDPRPGANVRAAGEMGPRGRVLLEAGRRLTLEDLVAAAGCGADPLAVHPRPRVAVLSTGDEVVSWRQNPGPHQVRDSNRLATALGLGRAGGEVVICDRVKDEAPAIRAAVERALEEACLIVTIGGVSMGRKDLLPGIFEGLGVDRLFHGVKIQPGKPVWAGRKGSRLVLGLPGNPVSALVILELFAVPLLARLSGGTPQVPRGLEAGIAGGSVRSRFRPRFLPASLEPGTEGGPPRTTPRPQSGSGDWTALAGAQALLFLPPETAVEPGRPVSFLRL